MGAAAEDRETTADGRPTDARVLCVVTGQPTPIPKRGPRSMYVNRDASDLQSRLNQATGLLIKLRDEVGFTDAAKARFEAVLAALGDIPWGRDLVPAPRRRRRSKRITVRLDADIAAAIDSLPGDNRTAKVNELLLLALGKRDAGSQR